MCCFRGLFNKKKEEKPETGLESLFRDGMHIYHDKIRGDNDKIHDRYIIVCDCRMDMSTVYEDFESAQRMLKFLQDKKYEWRYKGYDICWTNINNKPEAPCFFAYLDWNKEIRVPKDKERYLTYDELKKYIDEEEYINGFHENLNEKGEVIR